MRLILLVLAFFIYCNYAVASVCEGAFEKKLGKTYPSMSTWSWSYSTGNTSLVGDQKEYDARLSIGAVEDKACMTSEECIVSDTICAVKTSLRSLLNEAKEIDKPVRLRVVSYGVYLTLMERIVSDLTVSQTCEKVHQRYYVALKDFWTEALRDIGYRVTDIHPFEVKFDLKPEYLRDDECFHRIGEVKDRIISLDIPGDAYGRAWARIGFGVSWYGADFFPAFDIKSRGQTP